MKTFEILSKNLKFAEGVPMVKSSKALKDVQPELEKLRQKSISKASRRRPTTEWARVEASDWTTVVSVSLASAGWWAVARQSIEPNYRKTAMTDERRRPWSSSRSGTRATAMAAAFAQVPSVWNEGGGYGRSPRSRSRRWPFRLPSLPMAVFHRRLWPSCRTAMAVREEE
nr:vacuolar protein sorting-associated protein 52 A-like isoform X2 [Ipomoea trifida]